MKTELPSLPARAATAIRQLLDALRYGDGGSRRCPKSLGNFFTVRDVLKYYDAEPCAAS